MSAELVTTHRMPRFSRLFVHGLALLLILGLGTASRAVATDAVIAPEVAHEGESEAERSERYLEVVQTFADTLLEHGRDHYGPENTPLWAAMLDAESLSMPGAQGLANAGLRSAERAVGGSNLQHDVITIQALDRLSDVTGDPRYREAVEAYVQAYFDRAQLDGSGLLVWGGAFLLQYFK